MNLGVFRHYLYIRTTLSNKNVGQVKAKKQSKIGNISVIVLLWHGQGGEQK